MDPSAEGLHTQLKCIMIFLSTDLLCEYPVPFPRHSMRIFPLTTANLLILDNQGFPANLLEESAARPTSYQVIEYCLTTGDFIRGTQQSAIASKYRTPDPDAPFAISAFSQEQGNTLAFGILAGFFVVGTRVLPILGFALLQR